MELELIVRFVTYLVPMLLSLTVHEYAHARMAYWLGDDTASMQGRLTLNPIAHVDPIGTLLVPAFGIMSGFPFFGWAKPVPTNPLRYNRRLFGSRVSMTSGMAMVAAAGPLSNLFFAIVIAAVLGAMKIFHPPAGYETPGYALFYRVCLVNIGLFLFNLLPVPPLDGSRILYWIMPDRYKPIMDTLSRSTPIVFIGLILLMNTGIFYRIFTYPFLAILQLLTGVFGLQDFYQYIK